MPMMSWTVELKLDVKAIDDDHQKLLENLNRLHEAIVRGSPRSTIGEILTEGLQLTASHFQRRKS
jgi:hemerythrin